MPPFFLRQVTKWRIQQNTWKMEAHMTFVKFMGVILLGAGLIVFAGSIFAAKDAADSNAMAIVAVIMFLVSWLCL